MKIITTIADLRNLVDGWSGSEGLGNDTGTHEQNVEMVARKIADKRPDELRWGQDWSSYLDNIKPVFEYLES